jgi:hypothetical protein
MNDVRQKLRQATDRVGPPDRLFERMVVRRDRRRRRQRVTSAVIAIGVAVVVVGGAVSVLVGLGNHPGQSSGEQDRLALSPGQYLYLDIRSSRNADGYVRDERTWWALDGSGEVRNTSTRQDKYPTPASGTYAAGTFPMEVDVSGLSTDPTELVEQLGTGKWADMLVGEAESERLWEISGILLELPNTPPDLRAALFEMASRLDGITIVPETQDPGGRLAVALVRTNGPDTRTMYFDPQNHQLMAWTSAHGDGPRYWEVIDSGVVDPAGAAPVGTQWLFPQSSSTVTP